MVLHRMMVRNWYNKRTVQRTELVHGHHNDTTLRQDRAAEYQDKHNRIGAGLSTITSMQSRSNCKSKGDIIRQWNMLLQLSPGLAVFHTDGDDDRTLSNLSSLVRCKSQRSCACLLACIKGYCTCMYVCMLELCTRLPSVLVFWLGLLLAGGVACHHAGDKPGLVFFSLHFCFLRVSFPSLLSVLSPHPLWCTYLLDWLAGWMACFWLPPS
jgi:hypothetical protein